MYHDKDAFLLNRKYNQQQRRAFADAWKDRHARKVKIAWLPGGHIDHTPDLTAPYFTLARYGYLLPLDGSEVIEAYNEYTRRHNTLGSLGDRGRWAFEDEYIKTHR